MVASIPVVFGTSTYTAQLPLNAIVTEIGLNITTAFGGGASPSVQVGSVAYVGTPAAPVITPIGTTGSTSYSYKVAGVDGNANTSAASAAGSTTTGNATLGGSNYNKVLVTTVIGQTYNIYRTVGGATQGLISTFTATAVTFQLNDSGIAATGSTPSTNTTSADLFNATLVSSQFLSPTAQPLITGNGQTVYVTLTGSPTSGAAYVTIAYYNPMTTVNGIND